MSANTFELGSGYTISRVIRGGWQLAGGHGAIDRSQAVADLIATFDAGIWTYDCADIYTGVEELIGAARLRLASERGLDVAARMKVHTKLVPDLERLASISRDYIRSIVDQSLRRLKTERLDLVQFHWWDYDQPRYVEAMGWLDELRLEGKVRNLGTTNFDTPRLAEILAAGIPLVSQQLQYSVLDQRPGNSLANLAAKHGVSFLCYGSVAGGFLSDKWLGVAEPATPLENRSLVKY
ncbi:aldo/keto reductase, partial [Mesorhizobium sp. M7A.F.Ca.CA.004.12.1.1]